MTVEFGTAAPAAAAGPEVPVLEVRSLSKSYGPVQALQDVSFVLRRGEVLGLLGDNGAGKTTLVKCVAGIVRPDDGSIFVDAIEAHIDSPQAAQSLGIETVHQGLALVSSLDVAANLFLNREIVRRSVPLRWIRWMDKRSMYRQAEAILEQLQISVAVRRPIERLSGGQRQAVAVGRAVGWGRHIVLMDEPAAALGVEQARHVLELIDRLRDRGVAVLFISHNMQQVVDVCDRAVVLRHGRKVADLKVSEVTARDLVDFITGARLSTEAADQETDR
ncbi:MAG: ATP-binding cassette domain-containing protein [Acidimicrobiales bacterium]